MAIDPNLASANVLPDENFSNSSIKKQSLAPNVSVEQRKHRHSFSHWFKKNLDNVTSSYPRHEETPRRPRAETLTHSNSPYPRDEETAPRKRAETITLGSGPGPARIAPSTIQALENYERPRPSILPAPQYPSVLQFALGR